MSAIADLMLAPYPGKSRVTVAAVIESVAKRCNVPASMLIIPDGWMYGDKQGPRQIQFSHPRQIAMFLARELTGLSQVEIGRRFGGRDHTTVIHACRAVEMRLATCLETESVYVDVRRMLGVEP